MDQKKKKLLVTLICTVVIVVIGIVSFTVISHKISEKRNDKIIEIVKEAKVSNSSKMRYISFFYYFDENPTYRVIKYNYLPSKIYIDNNLKTYEQTTLNIPKGKNIYYLEVALVSDELLNDYGYYLEYLYFAVDLNDNKVTYVGRKYITDDRVTKYDEFNDYPQLLATVIDNKNNDYYN